MSCKICFAIAGAAVVTISGSIALASIQDRPGTPPTTPPAQQQQLPPGWTQEDMQKCIDAGTPGEMQEWLAEGVGVWRGQAKNWMAPNTEPVASTITSTCTPLYDGRYIKCEIKGESPMGAFEGVGFYGFDNTSQTFQSSWIDNMSTGIYCGTGERSSDGTSIEWTYSYTCPITKKNTTMREVETITGENTRTFEIYGIDPKSGREYKMLEVQFTRSSGTVR